MEQYTIYCSPEQTKKAFELGAPIVLLPNYEEYKGFPFVRHTNGNEYPCVIPTAEQMIGWIEQQGMFIQVMKPYNNADLWLYYVRPVDAHRADFNTRKEATLAAIDAALDYLMKKKK